ncbi:MAG: Crp/Fnr family transcriptional regulator [Clostridia bacterium]|nr:Crp/Fnr family transcriptional regulator [Clostridia bacterium]
MEPFNNLNNSQINKLFDLLDVHIYKYNKNEEILPTIKKGNIICIVIEGYAQIIYIEYNGNEIIVENLFKNSVFGTNMSGTNNDNCQIIAKENTQVLVIDYNKLINPKNLSHNYFNIFFRNLFDITNTKFRDTIERVKILEKKQIRDKLLDYFEVQYKKTHSKFIYLPFSLKDFADYIAVNRSAMFRELRHLKDDKLIEIKDRRITLLYKQI